MIVGLGNPGKEYAETRHNFGFMVVYALLEEAERNGSVNRLSRQNDPYELWRCTFPGAGQWLLQNPLTYMNRSGLAVQPVAAYYRLEPEEIVVAHDELDLPLGRMKFKKGGGNAGHNGLKSIQQMLGTPDFCRLRLGVGKGRGGQGANHVLSRFAQDERDRLQETIHAAVKGLLIYMREGFAAAQQFCNGFALPEPPAEEIPAADKNKD